MPGGICGSALRRFEPGDLVVGRLLPGHVRDRSGAILIRAGQTLSEAHLQMLGERASLGVYAGGDWPEPKRIGDEGTPTTTPSELVQALQRRRGTGGRPARVRRHERHAWRVRLSLVLELRNKNICCRREFTVLTRDISVAGFSFTSQQYVYPGTVVFGRFDMLPNRPIMKGVVRNCEHLELREHRVGVEFLKLNANEAVPFA